MKAVVATLALTFLLAAGPNSACAQAQIQNLSDELSAGQHPGIEAMVVHRQGRVLATAVSSAIDDELPDLRSVTKSITALLVGIALDQGSLGSVEQPIAELLPAYAKAFSGDPRKARITIADLLTMRSGLACDDWNPKSPGHEDKMYRKRDWVRFWISQPMVGEPGSQFSYCTGNAIALGLILKQATGRSVAEFAADELFTPLGIRSARWQLWNRGREIDSGGHLHLHPESLARIGDLVGGAGRAGDRQLVSSRWIDQMTQAHTPIPGRQQSYGYLWWLDQTTRPELPRTRILMAWGNGGSFLIVMPELQASVVFIGTRYNRPEALEPMLWLRDRILPAWAPQGTSTPVNQGR
ncbi:MAG: serine hydrolase domain-containing protein [Lysobacterales bacterium]